MSALPPVERPNGKLYRPRKVVAFELFHEDEDQVMVLGTHDVAAAQPLADKVAMRVCGSLCRAARPRQGWYRDGYSNGERAWVWDDVHGRAAVVFLEVTETETAS